MPGEEMENTFFNPPMPDRSLKAQQTKDGIDGIKVSVEDWPSGQGPKIVREVSDELCPRPLEVDTTGCGCEGLIEGD
jgi:hypothetical protein